MPAVAFAMSSKTFDVDDGDERNEDASRACCKAKLFIGTKGRNEAAPAIDRAATIP